MSISAISEARGLERLIWLKYYIVLKHQNTFNLELNATKNMPAFSFTINEMVTCVSSIHEIKSTQIRRNNGEIKK